MVRGMPYVNQRIKENDMGLITGFLAAKGLAIAGAGIGGLILSYLLKKFVTQGVIDDVGIKIEKIGYGIGLAATLGLAKWKYTKRFWNNILEPPLILVAEQFKQLVVGFIRGLRSDNPVTK